MPKVKLNIVPKGWFSQSSGWPNLAPDYVGKLVGIAWGLPNVAKVSVSRGRGLVILLNLSERPKGLALLELTNEMASEIKERLRQDEQKRVR